MGNPNFRYSIQFRSENTPYGLVVYGFTLRNSHKEPWDSNSANNIQQINFIMQQVSGKREITIAIPRIFAPKFTVMNKFEELNILIGKFQTPNIPGFLLQRIILKNVSVLKMQSVEKPNGLASPPNDLWNDLLKFWGESALRPLAITLHLGDGGDAYVEGDIFAPI
jgi:hypothetical protein